MSDAKYDPDTAAQDLFYKVTRSDGKVTYDTARTWGRDGNANVLASRKRDFATQDEKEREKNPTSLTHVVDQVTRDEYLRMKRRDKRAA